MKIVNTGSYTGDTTTPFHNEYTSPNWFALRLDAHNRYHFLGNPRYFARDTTQPETNPFYADVLARYAQAKAQFRATGTIAQTEFLDELGGGFSFGNWTEAAPIPSAFELTIRTLAGNQVDWDDPNNGISITLAGKPAIPHCMGGSVSLWLQRRRRNYAVLRTRQPHRAVYL